jgi:hypothetical protein
MSDLKPWDRQWGAPTTAPAGKPWEREWAAPAMPAPSTPAAAPAAASPPGPSDTVRNVVQTVVSPLINMADYPIRATAADIVGMVKGGVPISGPSRESFNKEREKSLEATALPESATAKKIEHGIGSAVTQVGRYTPPQLALRSLGIEDAIAPFQTMAGDALGLAGFSRGGARAVKTTTEKGASELVDALADHRADVADKFIQGAYSRTIKPSTTGRDTPAQRRTAISQIIEDKANLSYADADGNVVSSGHLPQSIDQFSQAIDQSKAKLFNEWDALAQRSGDAGGRVDTAPVVAALRKMASDESELRTRPDAAAHASALADRYEQAGELLPTTAQNDLVKLNAKLRGYYKNPLPIAPAEETAARELRKAVDHTVEETAAPGYRELRQRFGALRSIENDVERAARRVANREVGGGLLGRGIDLTAIGELATGFAFSHGLEGLVAAGLTKGVGEYVKWRREPNRVVEQMFRTAEKYHAPLPGVGALSLVPATGGMQPPRPTGPGQNIYGRTGPPPGVVSGGAASPPVASPARGVTPPVSDPFLTPPSGGFVQ